MTNKKYNLIYADPAWAFSNKKTGGSMSSAAGQQYRVSGIEDMLAIDVPSVAAEDCVLAMWWVGAMPVEAIAMVEAWGFKIKNMNGIVWNKLTANNIPFFGMGFWTRAGSESVLIATKGNPKPASRSVRAVFRSESQIQFEAKVSKHSAKPVEVRDLLVKLVGDVPRLEMFCRGSASGWDAWGDQAENSITIDSREIESGWTLKKATKDFFKNVSKSVKPKLACHQKTPEKILEEGC